MAPIISLLVSQRFDGDDMIAHQAWTGRYDVRRIVDIFEEDLILREGVLVQPRAFMVLSNRVLGALPDLQCPDDLATNPF